MWNVPDGVLEPPVDTSIALNGVHLPFTFLYTVATLRFLLTLIQYVDFVALVTVAAWTSDAPMSDSAGDIVTATASMQITAIIFLPFFILNFS